MNRSTQLVWSILAIALAACGPNRTNFDVAVTDAADRVVDTGPTCPSSQTLCSDVCVDTQTDRDNCGACGTRCATGQSCNNGACALECPAPEVECAGLCVITNTDNANCGACGNACAMGQVCSNGACSSNCQGGLTTCTSSGTTGDGGTDASGPRMYCAQINSDRANCGACGTVCGANETCNNGTCGVTCPTGQTMCGALCVDLNDSVQNCGACGTMCGAGEACVNGTCGQACPTDYMFCTDRCVNTQTDRSNCGACGTSCPAGQACVAGACSLSCATGRTNCSGICLDLQSDRLNCGACGNACGAGQVCSRGACAATCAANTASCGGNCVDLTTDNANCGTCGTACTTGQFCRGGACGASCLAGQTICGGHCVDLQTDPSNCGFCNGACGAGFACVGGGCRPLVGTDAGACPPPSVQCGTVCTDVQNDNTNCGTCGTACSADRTCAVGQCLAPCGANQVRCGTTCTDVRFDRNNCGMCGTVCGAGLSCGLGACVTSPTFRVDSMSTMGCVASPAEDTLAGDDCGGLAVGSQNVFYTGDSATVRLPLTVASVNAAATSPRAVGLVSNLQTGDVYTMMDATGTQQPTSSFPSGTMTITQLGLLDPATGAVTTTRVTLSMPLSIYSSGAGIYSGFGRVIFWTGAITGAARGYYNVDLPTGLVTPITTGAAVAAPPGAPTCETFAHWGTAEYFGGTYHVLYARSTSPYGIARYTPSTAMVDAALVGDFAGSRGDLCMAIFSPMNNRWYWHAESIPSWGGTTTSEVVGYCPGTFSTP